MPERMLLRIGSASAGVGATLGVAANLLYPRPADWSQRDAALRVIAGAEQGLWIGIHVGIFFAALLILASLVAIARTFSTGTAASFARLGVTAAVIGTALWSLLSFTDGGAMHALARSWADAPPAEKAAAFRVADAVAMLNGAVFAAAIIVGFGLTFLCYGLAVASDGAYPRWLGWIAAAGGIAAVLIGLLQTYQGPSVALTNVAFPIVSLMLTAWVAVIGVFLWAIAES